MDEEALHLPDLTVESVDRVAGGHLRLTDRNSVLDDDRRGLGYPQRRPAGQGTDPQAGAFHQLRLLGGLQVVELGDRAMQPDLAGRGVDQVHGYQPAGLQPELRLYDQVRDRAMVRIDDDAPDHAAYAVRATGTCPDREVGFLGHGCFPSVGVGGRVPEPSLG